MKKIDSEGRIWLLTDRQGVPVEIGEKITCFRGEVSVLDSAEVPRHAGSTGRVNNFFPSVFNLEWRKI